MTKGQYHANSQIGSTRITKSEHRGSTQRRAYLALPQGDCGVVSSTVPIAYAASNKVVIVDIDDVKLSPDFNGRGGVEAAKMSIEDLGLRNMFAATRPNKSQTRTQLFRATSGISAPENTIAPRAGPFPGGQKRIQQNSS